MNWNCAIRYSGPEGWCGSRPSPGCATRWLWHRDCWSAFALLGWSLVTPPWCLCWRRTATSVSCVQVFLMATAPSTVQASSALTARVDAEGLLWKSVMSIRRGKKSNLTKVQSFFTTKIIKQPEAHPYIPRTTHSALRIELLHRANLTYAIYFYWSSVLLFSLFRLEKQTNRRVQNHSISNSVSKMLYIFSAICIPFRLQPTGCTVFPGVHHRLFPQQLPLTSQWLYPRSIRHHGDQAACSVSVQYVCDF